MTVSEAREKVEKIFKSSGLNIGSILDDGKYFVFGYAEEVDVAPFGVDKSTGEVIDYFPPDHYDDFIKAKEIESTVK